VATSGQWRRKKWIKTNLELRAGRNGHCKGMKKKNYLEPTQIRSARCWNGLGTNSFEDRRRISNDKGLSDLFRRFRLSG
jgi:hypothetical protein